MLPMTLLMLLLWLGIVPTVAVVVDIFYQSLGDSFVCSFSTVNSNSYLKLLQRYDLFKRFTVKAVLKPLIDHSKKEVEIEIEMSEY